MVHILLDKIGTETPELKTLVENFRLSFSENPSVLTPGFFQTDVEAQREMLLKDVVLKGKDLHEPEIAIIRE